MDQGINTGEDEGVHQPGYPEWDAEQRHKLDVPAADSAVCGKGDSKQENKASQKSRNGSYSPICRGKVWRGTVHQQGCKKAPGQESKQGSIAYPVVPFIVKSKSGKKQQGECMVCKKQLIHVWSTSHRTGCPESVRRHLH